ncbi:hypothetical protein J7K93_00135 [bacterium]|nr:hypothetical protein [bacterium]
MGSYVKEVIAAAQDDDKFFLCALAGDVKIIVSRNKHLLDATGYHRTEVLRPFPDPIMCLI